MGDTNDTPGTLVNLWTSKRGLKASVVTVVVGPSLGGFSPKVVFS